jgi:hypothetical protein
LAPLLSFTEIGLLPSFFLRRKSGKLIGGRLIFRIEGHERLISLGASKISALRCGTERLIDFLIFSIYF